MRYQADKPAVVTEPPSEPPPPQLDSPGWSLLPQATLPDAPVEFVHETDGPAWAQLPRFWNDAAVDKLGAVFLSPMTAGALAATPDVVRIKVPAGLDDPRPFLPTDPADPPTVGKWRLGRDLFCDANWLSDSGDQACASCHKPREGFADNVRSHGEFNTPTLVNCVFNRRQFWDGRVGSLEEVVQRTVADETAPADKTSFHHVWSGVVRRLRMKEKYAERFNEIFGGEPTEDAVGKALATYLRTLLAADSIHDRAVRKAGKIADLKAEHYEQALGDDDVKRLGFEPTKKADAAKKIYEGYRLFHDLEEHKTGCLRCHGGAEFTDGKFHNIGVGFTWAESGAKPGDEPGRFASLPVGRKDHTLIGAYKTPTLRGLPRTGPYFHDGSAATLEDAVRFHIDIQGTGAFLDADLHRHELSAEESADLILFLRALEGTNVDPSVGPAPPS